MRTIFAVAVLLAAISTPADARPRHSRTVTLAPECGVSMPCDGGSYSPFAKRLMTVPFGTPLQQYTPQRAWKQAGSGRPSRWCGWYLRTKKGLADARLNLARNWAYLYGSPSSPQPGAVVVWRHHVGELVSHVSGSIWVVHSGNDGNAVRTRPRSIAGAIAFRA